MYRIIFTGKPLQLPELDAWPPLMLRDSSNLSINILPEQIDLFFPNTGTTVCFNERSVT